MLLLGNITTILKKEICSFDQWNEIPVLNVGVKPPLPGQRQLAYQKLYRACKKELKRHQVSIEQFDVIHSHSMFMGGFIAMNLAKDFSKSFFHTEHTSGLIFKPEQYNQFDKSTIREVFNSAKKVFFVSQYALDETLDQYSVVKTNSHEVLPNVVDDLFFDKSESSDNTFELFRYLTISNLIPRKRVDLLLRAWLVVLRVFPDSRLTIAGDGPEKENLISFVKLHGLEQSVNFVPKLSRSEVKSLIEKHHESLSRFINFTNNYFE